MKSFFLLASILLLFLASCKEKCAEPGLGGNTTLSVHPKHHNDPIVSEELPGYPDSAWVKFNSSNFPGTNPSGYDLILVGEAGEDHIHIEGLKCGNYFIYMTGFDTSINERVTGGIPYTIAENAPSEIDLDIPVTE